MGACCSKSNALSGGHTLVDPRMGANNSVPVNVNDRRKVTGQTRLGGATEPTESAEVREERRLRALAAAEERRKAENVRGTNKSNPNAGKLSSQLKKPLSPQAQEREEQPLVWD